MRELEKIKRERLEQKEKEVNPIQGTRVLKAPIDLLEGTRESRSRTGAAGI